MVARCLILLLRAVAPAMPAEEILATVSVLVGQLIAVQDQRRFSPDAVMALVASNIEIGNRAAVQSLMDAKGGTA